MVMTITTVSARMRVRNIHVVTWAPVAELLSMRFLSRSR